MSNNLKRVVVNGVETIAFEKDVKIEDLPLDFEFKEPKPLSSEIVLDVEKVQFKVIEKLRKQIDLLNDQVEKVKAKLIEMAINYKEIFKTYYNNDTVYLKCSKTDFFLEYTTSQIYKRDKAIANLSSIRENESSRYGRKIFIEDMQRYVETISNFLKNLDYNVFVKELEERKQLAKDDLNKYKEILKGLQ